jgi:uncharacterized membrane protein YhaH (DUF805 family)
MKQLLLVSRLLFGAWMLANGVNHFFFPLWAMPTGHQPLAIQLMAALVHSGLFGVAMAIELVTGALIVTGFFVPVALCVVMPVSTCALYWSVILDHQPLGAVLGVAAFALNGFLMLAYLGYYRAVLQSHALALGESSAAGESFELMFVNPNGRTPRGQFIAALITLLAVAAFYAFRVKGVTAHWCLLMLVFPAVMLHARRLHDIGHTAWLLVAPAVLTIAAFAVWLRLVSVGTQLGANLTLAAFIVSIGFAVWGCIGRGQAATNRFGSPVAA